MSWARARYKSISLIATCPFCRTKLTLGIGQETGVMNCPSCNNFLSRSTLTNSASTISDRTLNNDELYFYGTLFDLINEQMESITRGEHRNKGWSQYRLTRRNKKIDKISAKIIQYKEKKVLKDSNWRDLQDDLKLSIRDDLICIKLGGLKKKIPEECIEFADTTFTILLG